MEDLAVEIASYELIKPQEGRKQYTVFNICVRSGGSEWKIAHRYTTFRQLHEALQKKKIVPGNKLPKLPGKKITNSFSPEFLESRRSALEMYLRSVMGIKEVRESNEFASIMRIDLKNPPVPGTTLPAAAAPRSSTENTTLSDALPATSSESGSSSVFRAIALYDFTGDHSQYQIDLQLNAIVEVEDADPSGWWLGTCNGERGYFPGDYVQVLTSDGTPNAAGPNAASVDAVDTPSPAQISSEPSATQSPSEPASAAANETRPVQLAAAAAPLPPLTEQRKSSNSASVPTPEPASMATGDASKTTPALRRSQSSVRPNSSSSTSTPPVPTLAPSDTTTEPQSTLTDTNTATNSNAKSRPLPSPASRNLPMPPSRSGNAAVRKPVPSTPAKLPSGTTASPPPSPATARPVSYASTRSTSTLTSTSSTPPTPHPIPPVPAGGTPSPSSTPRRPGSGASRPAHPGGALPPLPELPPTPINKPQPEDPAINKVKATITRTNSSGGMSALAAAAVSPSTPAAGAAIDNTTGPRTTQRITTAPATKQPMSPKPATRDEGVDTPLPPVEPNANTAAGDAALPGDQRGRIAREILETEQSYVASLQTLVNNALKPLAAAVAERGDSVMKEADLKDMFSNIEIILNFNATLLAELEARMKQWTNAPPSAQLLGDIFLKMAPFLKMYNTYGNNYEHAIEILNHYNKEGSAFHTVVTSALANAPARVRLPLEGLLIMPIQRIPRYNLLLNELIKNTEPTHPDYANLKGALDRMKEVADHINESIRKWENARKLVDISLKGTGFDELVAPHRHLLRDGVLIATAPPGGSKSAISKVFSSKNVRFLLFNDLLVYAHENKLSYVTPLYLLWMDRADVAGGVAAVREARSFRLTAPETGPIAFHAATIDETVSWFEDIRKNIIANLGNGAAPTADAAEPRRYGRYKYNREGTFEGDWRAGKRHGRGSMTFPDSSRYDGEWEENMRHGTGTLVYATGDRYEGTWEADRPHGRGVLTHAQPVATPSAGDRVVTEQYVGEFKAGRKHGSGKFSFANGAVYEGEVRDDLPNGAGKMRWVSGQSYEGYFKDGLPHGIGLFVSPSGRRYDGEWVRGRREGKGSMDYAGPGGEGFVTYEGFWRDDRRHGYGTFIDKNAGITYRGEWANDAKHGKGKLVYTPKASTQGGYTYEGEFCEDKYHGHGVLTTDQGKKYEGDWQHGRRHGKGVLAFQNGDKFEGTFEDDKPDGKGVYTTRTGIKFECKWEKGRRVGKSGYVLADGTAFSGQVKPDGVMLQMPDFEVNLFPLVPDFSDMFDIL